MIYKSILFKYLSIVSTVNRYFIYLSGSKKTKKLEEICQ